MVNLPDSRFKLDFRLPPQFTQPGSIQQFLRCAVRSFGIPIDAAFKTHNIGNYLRQLKDGLVPSPTDIDNFRFIVATHQKHTGIGQVVDMQEFAPRRARAPEDYHRLIR